jgi:hypothetical protein
MTKSDDLPPPDLIDTRGRMRRLVLSFVIAVVCATIAYLVSNGLAKPDEMPGGFDGGSKSRAFGFVGYMTGIAFAASFAISLAIQNALEKRRYVKSLGVPQAKVRSK